MIKKLKILGPILLVIILVVIIGSYQIKNQKQNSNVKGTATAVEQGIDVSLKLTYPDGQSKDYSVNLNQGQASVFDALKKASEKEGFVIEYEIGSYGAFVKSIDGIPNTKTEYWLYSVNNKPGQIASDQYQLKNGDQVKWEFTK